jgi:hypothetical protein
MTNVSTTAATTPATKVTGMAIGTLIVGWLIPGGGHFMQKKWIRGLLLFAAICTLFFVGLGMKGKVYSANTGDLLDILGFFGDIGAGGLYMLTRINDWGQGAINRAVADYGTKYIIVAGLLNLVCAIDAFHIAIGKKK